MDRRWKSTGMNIMPPFEIPLGMRRRPMIHVLVANSERLYAARRAATNGTLHVRKLGNETIGPPREHHPRPRNPWAAGAESWMIPNKNQGNRKSSASRGINNKTTGHDIMHSRIQVIEWHHHVARIASICIVVN